MTGHLAMVRYYIKYFDRKEAKQNRKSKYNICVLWNWYHSSFCFFFLRLIDLDARPWDFQAEECALRSAVDRFNSRRYDKNSSGCAVMVWKILKQRKMKVHKTAFDRQDPEYEPVDNWLTSVLSHPVELTDEFKRHYEIWLQQEVFQASIDWDQLVASHLIWWRPCRVYLNVF